MCWGIGRFERSIGTEDYCLFLRESQLAVCAVGWFFCLVLLSWGFLSACAEGVSVETEGLCPAGRAFFLSLNKKKQKINTGAAPLWTRF